MNATLFDHRLQIDRSRLIANSNYVYVDVGWATLVSEQIVRAAGFAGSQVVNLVGADTWATWQTPSRYRAVAEVTLPHGVFGSTMPPAIWAMPQYGSVVVYKQFLDNAHKMIQYTPPFENKGEMFHTWIQGLQSDNATIGGSVYIRWSFTVVHEFTVREFVNRNNPPFNDMYWSWNPRRYENPGPLAQQVPRKIILHWYALGMDPSLL